MSFYIDLSEFLGNPITTGIQRIAGEICRYLPPDTAIPVRLDSRGYVALPPALVTAIGKHFRDAGQSGVEEIRRLGAVKKGSAVRLLPSDILLIPEVFTDPQRLKFFNEMPEAELQRCRFIVYDLLPMTHPEYFAAGSIVNLYGYYRMLRRATCCAFISEDTRADYYGRLKRTAERAGVILPLGCDALGPKPNRTTLNRPLTFSVLGTIEPRKNHKLILEAFEPLLRKVAGLRLSFIGKMGWVDAEFAQKVHALAEDENSGLEFHPGADDGSIRRHIEKSRATIYVSAAEGYGLPPVESLWVGTPVIASANIPSLKGLGGLGVHFVEPLNPDNLRQAVLAFLDDAYANRRTEETERLNLPNWRSFAEEVFRWCVRGVVA
jgi:glycosyltransferase involved in cell wall biosynthesis